MKTNIRTLALMGGVAALAMLAYTTSAQIIYVDATDGAAGNTAIAPSYGGGVFTPVQPPGTQGPANDGLWDVRAFENGGTIYQNAGAGANIDTNAVRLATTVSGLTADTYNVYAYFWTDSSPTWRIGASLSDTVGQLTLYQAGSAGVTQYYTGADAGVVMSTSLTQNPFTSSVFVADGNRRLLEALLGTVTGTGFTVYLEGDRNMTGYNQRTWYDGVGYGPVPEPATMGLMGLGTLLGVLVIRRRK